MNNNEYKIFFNIINNNINQPESAINKWNNIYIFKNNVFFM